MKINVAVLFGGKSVEHEISVISAQQAMHAMNKEKYQVTPVYITKQNEFYTGEALLSMDEYKNIPKLLAKCDRVDLVKEEAGVFLNYHTKKAFQKPSICKIDVAFPVVHGTNVEDGALQGFLETLCLPYVGCDVTASAMGMDKYVMKTVLKDKGIPVLDCMCFYAREFLKDADSVLNKLEVRFSYPVIVKPANLGSSVGIKIAKDRASLTSAIENAAGYAAKILVEKAITNLREINCSVLGDSDGTKASVCEEPVGGDEILSYKDKYLSGGKSAKSQGMSSLKKRLPADLAADTTEKIRQMAQDTFLAIGASRRFAH